MTTLTIRLACAIAVVVACGVVIAGPWSAPNNSEWMTRTWQVDDGLPDSSATAMVQTPDGYLWFGTFGGLVRFDGVAFTVLTPGNTPQLPSRAIVNLHLDQRGRLWVSTQKGLVVRDGTHWLDFTEQSAFGGDFVRTFAERKNGDLLLTTFKGKVVEFSERGFVPLPNPPGEPKQGYWGGVDENGEWWVVQNRFVGRWDRRQWVQMLSETELEGVVRDCVACAAARDGGLWVLAGTSLRRFSHGIEVCRRELPESPCGIWGLFEDSQSNVWLASHHSGLYQLTPNGRMHQWSETESIPCRSFRFVFEDHERNLWVGTNGRGLIRLTRQRFQDWGTRDALSAPVTSVAIAPEGGLWVATYGRGLYRLTEEGLVSARPPDFPGDPLFIQSVLSDRRGRTWIGVYADGLFVLDGTVGRIVPEGKLIGNNVIAMFEDSRGRIWFSGGRQIAVLDGGVTRVFGPEDGLSSGNVVCFAEDEDQVVWLTNQIGVFRVVDERIVEVTDLNGRPIADIVCLKSDTDGTMWMGSTTAGLVRWRDGALAALQPDCGLPVEEVLGIVDDERGFLWLASPRGVARLAKANLHARADKQTTKLASAIFDSTDGLPSMECSGRRQPVCTRDSDGRLWFATTRGVGMIDPAHLQLSDVPPQVHIERITYHTPRQDTDNGASEKQSVVAPFSVPLQLPAGSHRVEIYYTAPSFTAPTKVRFQVRLDHVDSTWRDVARRRTAYFDNLGPGQYAFHVRACNGDGVWNEVGTSLQFRVLPYFWETNWFRVLVAISICAALFIWIHRIRGRLERRRASQAAFAHQLIARQERERTRIASELHDGLGHELLLIKNRLTTLAQDGELADKARQQVEDLSVDVTRAISDVRSVSHMLRPGALEQVGPTHAIRWMTEELSTATALEFATELDDIDGLLTPEMEINLYRIVQEALNNVVKHAAASYVSVTVRRSSSNITVVVEDNGCGFDPRPPRGERVPSFGLTSMNERADLLGGLMDLESAPGMGTRVTVTVPVRGASE